MTGVNGPQELVPEDTKCHHLSLRRVRRLMALGSAERAAVFLRYGLWPNARLFVFENLTTEGTSGSKADDLAAAYLAQRA